MNPAPLLVLLLLCRMAWAQEPPPSGTSQELLLSDKKLYPIECGYLRYVMQGQEEDTLVLVFDRYGWRQTTAEYGKKLYYGLKTDVHTRKIQDGVLTWNLNLLNSTGSWATDNVQAKMASYKNWEQLLEARMAQATAIRTDRTAEYLGKTCEVWTYSDGGGAIYEIWTWQGITLRTETPKGTLSAEEIKLDCPAEAWFQVPDDITWK